jgi:hypothetical protein
LLLESLDPKVHVVSYKLVHLDVRLRREAYKRVLPWLIIDSLLYCSAKRNRALLEWKGPLLVKGSHFLPVLTVSGSQNRAAIAGWLFLTQLVNLALPYKPVLSWTAIELLSFAGGVVVLRFVEPRINGAGAARRTYALACFIGALGMVVLAHASSALIAAIGILLASGIAFNVTRPVSVVWVNRRTTSEVRATVHSWLSQAESIGEIFGGFALTVLAESGGVSAALVASGALIALAGIAVAISRADRAPAAVFDSEQSDEQTKIGLIDRWLTGEMRGIAARLRHIYSRA